MQIISEFSPLYAAGSLTPTQERNFLMAVKNYTQESETEFTDPDSGLKSLRRQGKKLPQHVINDMNSRRPGSAPASLSVTSEPAPGAGAARPGGGGASISMGATAETVPGDIFQIARTAPKSTFFDLAATGTGFVPVLVAGVARNVPLDAAGKIGPEFQQSTAMLDSMTNRVVNTLQENPRFAEGERQQILKELKLAPRMFANKNGYINQIIGLDNVLEGIERRELTIQSQPRVGVVARQAATKKLEEITAVRELLGIQQRTITDPNVWKTLPPGDYIVVNPGTGFKELRSKLGPTR
jgi:hypothetical protein